MNKISALKKGTPESSLILLLPREDTREQKSATQKMVLTKTQQCWYPDLGLPASRTVGNKFLFCKSPHVWYSVIAV